MVIFVSVHITTMYNQLNHIAHLNDQITFKNNELAQLRASHTRRITEIDALNTDLEVVRNNNVELLNQINALERTNRQLKDRLRQLKPKQHYKSYTDLVSKSGRLHRRREYKTVFSNVLDLMSDISRANISVKLGTENVTFVWRRDAQNNVQGTVNDSEEDEDIFDVSQSDIFDQDGNYVKPFLRSIIYVMDKHKISHEAYHETRMVTKGFMPPIHVIKEEKCSMSEEIPYIKHPTVCIYICCILFIYNTLTI